VISFWSSSRFIAEKFACFSGVEVFFFEEVLGAITEYLRELEFVTIEEDFGLHWEFIGCNRKCLLGNVGRYTSEFKEDTSGFYRGTIHFDTSFSSSHRSLCGMEGIGMIWKYTNPELSSLS
jgi:hypothetical protein